MTVLADRVRTLAASFNEAERKRRMDYYAYLCEQAPQAETFDQHLAQYGRLLRTGERASDKELHTLEQLGGFPLPQELKAFYREIGNLMLHDYVEIPSATALLHKLQSDATWEKVPSLGLVDMIKASWGNDRFEFDAVNNCIDQEALDVLNQCYACVGWTHDGSGEAMTYFYFDQEGRFGSLSFHQDEFEELYDDFIVPMLTRSPAIQTLSDLVLAAVQALQPNTDL